jgi:4-hydroxymandelate oxidase
VQPKLQSTILGSNVSLPVLIAPTAFHRLAHADGESATARAASASGTILIASMASTVAIEEVAAAVETDGERKLWFQIYLQPDLAFTESIVRRAEAAGCSALVVTAPGSEKLFFRLSFLGRISNGFAASQS